MVCKIHEQRFQRMGCFEIGYVMAMEISVFEFIKKCADLFIMLLGLSGL